MTKTFEEELGEYYKLISQCNPPLVQPSDRAVVREVFFAGYMRGHEAAKQQALAQIARSMDPRPEPEFEKRIGNLSD